MERSGLVVHGLAHVTRVPQLGSKARAHRHHPVNSRIVVNNFNFNFNEKMMLVASLALARLD
jgi:hypothetical protein